MRDGSMFSTLVEYKAQAYYDEHPEMYLVTPEGGYVVEVFSALWQARRNPAAKLLLGAGMERQRRIYDLAFSDAGAFCDRNGRFVTSSDKVLTLSTCTNGGADRFIVMGRLVAVTE